MQRPSLAALIDPDPSASETATSLSQRTPFYATVAEMLNGLAYTKPDAAIVCVPNNLHVPVAKELAAAKIDILVEKPLCDTQEAGRALLEEAKRDGVKLLVGHHKRFNHYVMAAKQALDSGALGDITAMSAMWTGYKPDSYYTVP